MGQFSEIYEVETNNHPQTSGFSYLIYSCHYEKTKKPKVFSIVCASRCCHVASVCQ